MKVSIVTVCYNAVSTVEYTIKSVLSQKYSDYEYIIIDGGSTDGTVEIIKKYSDRLAYWVSEPDNGIYDAMNKSIKYATGQWVNFMNAGDSFADDDVLRNVFERNTISSDIKIIGGHTNLVYANRTELLKSSGADYTPYGIPFCHQSCFVKINDAHYQWQFSDKYRYAADYKIMYDTYFAYGVSAFLVVDIVIANYQMEGSFSFADTRKPQKEYLQIQSRHINKTWIKELLKYILRR